MIFIRSLPWTTLNDVELSYDRMMSSPSAIIILLCVMYEVQLSRRWNHFAEGSILLLSALLVNDGQGKRINGYCREHKSVCG